jgi:hypothetical protein
MFGLDNFCDQTMIPIITINFSSVFNSLHVVEVLFLLNHHFNFSIIFHSPIQIILT